MRLFASYLVLLALIISGCASYHLGHYKRAVPGGYDRVAIPMFVNKTQEPGIEAYFTEGLRTEFDRSRLASVTSKNEAQVILEGAISKLSFTPSAPIDNTSTDLRARNPVANPQASPGSAINPNPLPDKTILSKQFIVNVTVHLLARKVSDNSVLWEGDFEAQRSYLAPLLGTPGLASSNAIYNQSSRNETLARMSKDMMSEAHDRLTENF